MTQQSHFCVYIPKEQRPESQKDIIAPVFTTLFTTVKRQKTKQNKYPLTYEWIMKIRYLGLLDYHWYSRRKSYILKYFGVIWLYVKCNKVVCGAVVIPFVECTQRSKDYKELSRHGDSGWGRMVQGSFTGYEGTKFQKSAIQCDFWSQ